MNQVLYQFLVCDYYATGEGRTISLLITRAYPSAEDYTKEGTLKIGHTAKTIAAREFRDKFGLWYLKGAENLSSEDFFAKYRIHLSPYLEKLVLSDKDIPGNLNFSMQLHLNYS